MNFSFKKLISLYVIKFTVRNFYIDQRTNTDYKKLINYIIIWIMIKQAFINQTYCKRNVLELNNKIPFLLDFSEFILKLFKQTAVSFLD